MASGTIQSSLPLKYAQFTVNLTQLTWTASGGGKYYVSAANSIPIPDVTATQIVMVGMTNGFASLRATDFIQPVMAGTNKISFLSNVNEFVNPNAAVELQVLYY